MSRESVAAARRILVAGTSGSGKSTLARRIAVVRSIPHIEIDAIYWGADWTPNPDFARDVAAAIATERWVAEWQYPDARPLLLARADLLVWLDPPFRRVLRQVVARTVWRRIRHVEIWNGNREPPLRTFFTDRDHVIRWAIGSRHDTGRNVAEAKRAHPSLPVVRLRSRADLRRLVATLGFIRVD
jgi:adenylate kinase family enzyme